jgi:hypothetical protein
MISFLEVENNVVRYCCFMPWFAICCHLTYFYDYVVSIWLSYSSMMTIIPVPHHDVIGNTRKTSHLQYKEMNYED